MDKLTEIKLPEGYNFALRSGYDALDSLFGNAGGELGIRLGKVVLLSAQSGTGKTRLCMQAFSALHEMNDEFTTGYFSGEQNKYALKDIQESMKLNVGPFQLVRGSESRWEVIEAEILKNNIDIAAVDSYPMLEFPLNPDGTKMDTKAKCLRIQTFATENNVGIILINHTDKKGNRSGRNELLHLVDVAYRMYKRVIDGIKCVVFLNEKNREGTPVNVAIAFGGGVYDFTYAVTLDEDDNDDGSENESRVKVRKEQLRNTLLTMLQAQGGTLHKDEIAAGKFKLAGVPSSTLTTLLRALTDEGILSTTRKHKEGRGQPAIASWTLTQTGDAAATALDPMANFPVRHDDDDDS
jgi:hypothetical protein